MCVVQVVVTEMVNANIDSAVCLYTLMDIILRVATMVVAIGYVEIFLSPSEVWVSFDLEEAILLLVQDGVTFRKSMQLEHVEALTGLAGISVHGDPAMVDIVNILCLLEDMVDILRTFAEVDVAVQDRLLADI